MRRLATIAIAGLLAVSLVISVSCGDDDSDSNGGATTTGAPVETQTDAPTPSGPSGKITIALQLEPDSLDEVFTANAVTYQVLFFNVAEALTEYSPDGSDVEPLLAESWEEIDENTTRFHLRSGVTFHNGEPFNADVVNFNLTRAKSEESIASLFVTPITEAVVVDDLTVDIVHEPDGVIPQRMARLFMYPPGFLTDDPEAAVEQAIGTGPYEFVRWDRGERIVLTASDDYWGEAPSIKDVEFIFRTEAAVRLSLLQAGEADLVAKLNPEDTESLDEDQFLAGPGQFTEMMVFGLHDPLTSEPLVREAINYAIDHEALVNVFSGFAEPADGQYWPRTVGGGQARPEYRNPYDLDRARQLLEEAGVVGEELSIYTTNELYPKMGEVAEAVAFMIEEAGLEVDLNILPRSDLQPYLIPPEGSDPPPVIMFGSNIGGLLDAARGTTTYFSTQGPFGRYASPELDQMLAEASAASGEERIQLFQEIVDKLAEDVAGVPLLVVQEIYGVNPDLEFVPRQDINLVVADMSFK